MTKSYDLFFETQSKIVFDQLAEKLPKYLQYHSIEHTKDVLQEAERLGIAEGLADHEMLLLKIATIYHDNGFIRSPHDHEKVSCEIAREQLKNTLLTENDIEDVCSAIMATKIKQSPMDKISEILCDADLDYLGRPDFKEIAGKLYLELKFSNPNLTEVDWNKIQVNFLDHHHYFTKTNIALRTEIKDKHIQELRDWLLINDIP